MSCLAYILFPHLYLYVNLTIFRLAVINKQAQSFIENPREVNLVIEPPPLILMSELSRINALTSQKIKLFITLKRGAGAEETKICSETLAFPMDGNVKMVAIN